jgi:hypothetical protein
MDRIIFGDNQFFGINHMSEEKAQALSEKFYDLKNITSVIDTAYSCGINAFMLNANERAGEICSYLRENSSRYPDLRLYPSIPYPHKYANMVNESGIFNAFKEVIISGNTAKDILGIIVKGWHSFVDKDVIKVMQLLIDTEMKIFKGLNIKVLFLQNIITDLLLGLGVKHIFISYVDYVKQKYGVEPGFITMNLPKLTDMLLECGVENPIICSSINKIGYFMNPDISSYEQTIREKKFRPVAMSILASGAINPREAIEYVCRQPNIKSIVFGASSRLHIEETKAMIDNYSVANTVTSRN